VGGTVKNGNRPDLKGAQVSTYEMSAITVVTLVIYGFIMRHERTKRRLAIRDRRVSSLTAGQVRTPVHTAWLDSRLLIKTALTFLPVPGRKLG
jgi:hypothetical protein